jgi:hypothetical protein
MWADYENSRKITTLDGVIRLQVKIRRCAAPACDRYHLPYHPESEGRIALPEHEFGLDVIALAGTLRYAEHRSVPEIHQALRLRGVEICQRSVTNLLDRYDELLALSLADDRRLQTLTSSQGRVILAIDGLQPDVGHEVLWVLRDCLSGEVLLARSLLSSTEKDLAELLGTVRDALSVPIQGVVSDGQGSIRNAVERALPEVPHQLCHFHALREAAKPIYEADRHAKKELKKRVRGIRPIEREVEDRTDEESQAIIGYCAAVRSALTDDGRPPLEPSGLKLHERLEAIASSIDQVAEQRELPKRLQRLRNLLGRGLRETATLWPDVGVAYGWVHQAARILEDVPGEGSSGVRRRLAGLLGAMARHRELAGDLSSGIVHFGKVMRSYWPGLFHTYDVADLPRTNNDLEHLFGSHRYHERRATGRKVASPSLVLRGSVRMAAAAASRLQTFSAKDLAPVSVDRWQNLRNQLDQRRHRRVLRYRFRRNPQAYLANLEQRLLQGTLPS